MQSIDEINPAQVPNVTISTIVLTMALQLETVTPISFVRTVSVRSNDSKVPLRLPELWHLVVSECHISGLVQRSDEPLERSVVYEVP